jgi:uncharacterized SAM-binding protein YcdF (DUF218 family)
MRRFISTMLIASILAAAAMFGIVLYSENTQDIAAADVMVVFGCQVKAGGVPSDTLASRLNLAHDLYTQGLASAIIVSGGQGPDEPMSEAACMRDYLFSLGVPDEAIHMEDESTNTDENARFSYAIMQEQGYESVLCVTTGTHRQRAAWAMMRAGAADVQSAGCASVAAEVWVGRFRECLSLSKFFLQSLALAVF